MLAIRRSADNGHFAVFKHDLVAGPIVTCPKCSETFNLYAAPASLEAAEKVLIDYLRQNCPRHVDCFGADERARCGQCRDAYNVLGLWQGEGNAKIKAAYRGMAKKWHPDKFFEKDARLRREAEDHFREISKAYQHLTGHR
jgi:DnaJ-domain-containing protein 1